MLIYPHNLHFAKWDIILNFEVRVDENLEASFFIYSFKKSF